VSELREVPMEVDYAIIAKFARLGPEGEVSLMDGGLTTLVGPIPGIFPVPFYLATRISFRPDECGRPYRLAIDLADHTGNVIDSSESTVTPTQGRRPSVATVLQFNGVNIPAAGDYAVRVLLDGTVVKSVPLFIDELDSEADRAGHNGV
jgi:hypothetical protein